MTQAKKAFEHIVGKAENAVNQHFLLFSQGFCPSLSLIITDVMRYHIIA